MWYFTPVNLEKIKIANQLQPAFKILRTLLLDSLVEAKVANSESLSLFSPEPSPILSNLFFQLSLFFSICYSRTFQVAPSNI